MKNLAKILECRQALYANGSSGEDKPRKRFFFFTIALFLMAGAVCSVNAQDIIILKTGDEIKARVLEISPTEIRYKRFENQQGPTVVIPASRVLMIQYENGSREVINAVPASPSTAAGDPQRAQDKKGIAVFLNIVPGFGVGSFVQGDSVGGGIGLGGELLGYILLIAGAANPIMVEEEADYSGALWGETIEVPKTNPLVYVGWVMVVGVKIFEIIRPFTYANKFKVTMVPTFDAYGQPALAAVVNFKF